MSSDQSMGFLFDRRPPKTVEMVFRDASGDVIALVDVEMDSRVEKRLGRPAAELLGRMLVDTPEISPSPVLPPLKTVGGHELTLRLAAGAYTVRIDETAAAEVGARRSAEAVR